MAGKKKLQYEVVVWRDAWNGYSNGPVEPEDVEGDYYLTDVGWLVRDSGDEVVIASSRSAHTEDARVKYVTGIPKKNIVSRDSHSVTIPDPRKGK